MISGLMICSTGSLLFRTNATNDSLTLERGVSQSICCARRAIHCHRSHSSPRQSDICYKGPHLHVVPRHHRVSKPSSPSTPAPHL